MAFFDKILFNLPEVEAPKQKRLGFNERLKWTLIVLVLFYVMGMIPLWGASESTRQQFEQLSLLLGAEFGSLISLGIGPIVTGSIILQLLNGAGLVKMDLTTHEGKQRYQGLQKLMSIFFVIFESIIYVFMGGILPAETAVGIARFELQLILVFQLFLGSIIVLFMDEIVSKWGFGSGISLFIAAGISKQLMIRLFSFLTPSGTFFWNSDPNQVVGAVFKVIVFASQGNMVDLLLALLAIGSTIAVFAIAVYSQAMKVEIPLSFGRVRGHGIRWPLQFIYTSNIPVILVASLFATVQLWMQLLQNWMGVQEMCWLGANTAFCFPGGFSQGVPTGWFRAFNPSPLLDVIIRSNGQWGIIAPEIFFSMLYLLLMIGGSVLFSIFWMQTSGMDAESLADQIISSGLQIPGFRKDKRILVRLLRRYVMPLTVMGGITIGFLAAFADLLGALTRGTGLLLTVMIVYKLYEDIAKEHMYDMNPMLRKFMGK